MFKTFVINLEKDTQRMQFMHEQLTTLEIDYERQPAIYGNEYIKTISLHEGKPPLIPNELGCAMSHAQVYKKIVESNTPYSLVCEDDVALPREFKIIVEKMVTEQYKTNFEYLLFDYIPVGREYLSRWFQAGSTRIRHEYDKSVFLACIAFIYIAIKALYIIPLSLFEGFRNHYKLRNPGPVRFFRPVYYAGAYLITLEGAKKLLSLAEPVVYTADQLPNKARVMKGLRFYCFSPLIVKQKRKLFGSSILELSGMEVAKLYKKNDYI